MMERMVVPFRRWHYDWLAKYGASEGATVAIGDAVLASIEAENSWTAVVSGEPVVCGGTMQQWPGRHTAWAFIAEQAGPHMLWVTRQTMKKLDMIKGRIETTVRADFDNGLAWARLLGFEIETPEMRKYGPFGETHVGFVRFNP